MVQLLSINSKYKWAIIILVKKSLGPKIEYYGTSKKKKKEKENFKLQSKWSHSKFHHTKPYKNKKEKKKREIFYIL